MLNRFVLLGCALSLSGCVGHYQQPAASAPHATLEAKWGRNSMINGGSQGYWAYHDADCHDTGETGVLGALSSSNPEDNRFRVQPDRRIYLSAMTLGIRVRENDQGPLVHVACTNMSSFIPRAGARYQVTHTALLPGCSLQVTDLQTGQRPATLRVVPISKGCGL